MTIGDVTAAALGILLLFSSWIALITGISLIAPNIVARVRVALETGPARCFGVGFVVVGLVAFPTAITLHALVGGAKLIPAAALGALILSAAAGSAGVCSIIAGRSSERKPVAAKIASAAIVYCLAGLAPLAGWLIVTPIALFVSVGAVASALIRRPARKSAGVTEVAPSLPVAGGSQA